MLVEAEVVGGTNDTGLPPPTNACRAWRLVVDNAHAPDANCWKISASKSTGEGTKIKAHPIIKKKVYLI